MALRFGTAGVPHSSSGASTEDGIRRIRELGLDHMEMEWVRQVRVSADGAKKIRAVAEERDVTLTAHGPYYINLNAVEPSKMDASINRVLATARAGFLCGAKSILFHAGFFMKMPPEDAFQNIEKHLKGIMETLKKEKVDVEVRTELAGKLSAWGSLDEIIRMAQNVPGVLPAIDFSHQHARTNGAFNTYEEFRGIFDSLKKGLGPKILKNMHIHVSGIKYSAKGELQHLNFADANFNWRDFVRALVDCDIEGYLVCESPNLEEDALLLKNAYLKMRMK